MRPKTHEVTFGDLSDADRIQVTDNLNLEYDEVSDPAAIGRFVAWLGEREDGWYVPRDGVQIVSVQLNLYRSGTVVGSVGVGERYLVAHREGGFAQRDAAPGDRAEALAILGVDDPEG